MKSLGPWILIFVCALIFTFFVDLGGNFFGVPDSALNFLFAANLTLFLWLLARFVGKPMVSFMDTRREGIGEELEHARRKVDEAASLRDEVRRRLDEVEQEVTQFGERAERDGAAVSQALESLRQAAAGTENVMPYVLDAVRAYATLGEMTQVLKDVFGEFREPVRL